jgi:D-inositol-3-phosphate glycosyltransferase
MMVSDALCPTGFSRVGYQILRALSGRFDVCQVGINFYGEPHGLPWPVFPAQIQAESLEDRLFGIVERASPEVIVLLNDPWVVARLALRLRDEGYGGVLVGYCPVDEAPLPLSSASGLRALDHLVAYTEFGHRAFEVMFDGASVDAPPSSVIPHGLDREAFGPLVPGDLSRSRSVAKARLFPAEPRFQDSFVVLNANRNQPRKRIDITLRAFSEFARGKPDNVHLYLHMGRKDLGWDVITLAERFGIADRLIMSTSGDQLPALSDEQLNLVYNACEVGLNTCAAEGWGLVAFEHASCGGAQIMPAVGPLPALWGNAAVLVEPALVCTPPGHVTDFHLVQPSDVARVLERLYTQPDELEELSCRGLQCASDSSLSWRTIGATWSHLVVQFTRRSAS